MIKHMNSLFQPLHHTATSIPTVETYVIKLQLFERMMGAIFSTNFQTHVGVYC